LTDLHDWCSRHGAPSGLGSAPGIGHGHFKTHNNALTRQSLARLRSASRGAGAGSPKVPDGDGALSGLELRVRKACEVVHKLLRHERALPGVAISSNFFSPASRRYWRLLRFRQYSKFKSKYHSRPRHGLSSPRSPRWTPKMGTAASSSFAGNSLVDGSLCSHRCEEFEEVCCDSKVKNGQFRRRRATEGLIVIDPRLAAAEVGEHERFRARPTVHVQAFRQRYQLRSESLLRPYHIGGQPSAGAYAPTRAPAAATPRNRFSPIASLEAKVSTATQTQTPSYLSKTAETPLPSPPAAGQHDQTPSSLERNATAGATVTPGTAINGRTR